jgi:hypothetical protein
MGRPKDFTREAVLEKALPVFWRQGFADASLPELEPVPETFRRLEYVYSLRHELDSDWAARPLALERHDERPALEMEDRGGNLLEERLGQVMEVPQFLRLGISVAASLTIDISRDAQQDPGLGNRT